MVFKTCVLWHFLPLSRHCGSLRGQAGRRMGRAGGVALHAALIGGGWRDGTGMACM